MDESILSVHNLAICPENQVVIYQTPTTKLVIAHPKFNEEPDGESLSTAEQDAVDSVDPAWPRKTNSYAVTPPETRCSNRYDWD